MNIMMSHTRILASLSSKENMSPSRKRSSEDAFSSHTSENAAKRRTLENHPIFNMKPVFSMKLSNKQNIKKQTSIKNYYRDGIKKKEPTKMKILDENKEKPKQEKKSENDAFSLMCSDTAPEKYWELLAEERRIALEKALKENKELADEIREKDDAISELRTEVSELKETAKHAEYLASVLEELGKECNVSQVEEEEDSDNFESDPESGDEVFTEDYSDSYSDSDEEDAEDSRSQKSYEKKGDLSPKSNNCSESQNGSDIPSSSNSKQNEECQHQEIPATETNGEEAK